MPGERPHSRMMRTVKLAENAAAATSDTVTFDAEVYGSVDAATTAQRDIMAAATDSQSSPKKKWRILNEAAAVLVLLRTRHHSVRGPLMKAEASLGSLGSDQKHQNENE